MGFLTGVVHSTPRNTSGVIREKTRVRVDEGHGRVMTRMVRGN